MSGVRAAAVYLAYARRTMRTLTSADGKTDNNAFTKVFFFLGGITAKINNQSNVYRFLNKLSKT